MKISLSSRLVVSVVVIQAIMLGLLLWNSLRVININYIEMLENNAYEQTSLMSAALAPGLVAYDRAMIDDVVTLIKDSHNLVFLELFDREGRHISSLGDYEFRSLTDPGNDFQIFHKNDVVEVMRVIKFEGQSLGFLQVVYDTRVLQTITRDIRWQSVLISILTMCLLIVATILVSIVLTTNLKKLKVAVQDIQQGDLDQVVELSDADEFEELAIAFNQMAYHLRTVQNRLEKEHRAMTRQSEHLKALLNSVNAVIWEANAHTGNLIFVSKEAKDLLGYPIDKWYEPNFLLNHVYADDHPLLKQSLETLKESGRQISVDLRLSNISQKLVWIRIIASSVVDQYDQSRMIRGLILDIEYEKNREEKIVYLADHDALTGLINRRSFQEKLGAHMAYGSRYEHSSGLLFIDIDQFKYVNDTFGHTAGDMYLIQIAERLRQSLRETDILGRLGGDEFGVILPFADEAEAETVADNLLRSLSDKSWRHEGQDVHISASIGITLFPKKDKAAGDLLAEADYAMYVAKSLGRNQYHMFDGLESGMEKMHSKVHVEGMIKNALKNDQLVLDYQPIINLKTGDIAHFEALVRIREDSGNELLPVEFINTAEQFGIIQEIDRRVFEKVMTLITENLIQDQDIVYAVNLSAVSIEDDGFRKWVFSALYEVPEVCKRLIIEITETAAVESMVSARSFIRSLTDLGCRFAIDDFGVGFSSFHYIKHLPVDYIKIDGSFVQRLHQDDVDRLFVKAAIDIAKKLDIKIIAECVENERIVEVLKELKADFGQGYYLGRPEHRFD